MSEYPVCEVKATQALPSTASDNIILLTVNPQRL